MARAVGTRALVLGGGGVAGIAWETGVLVGLSAAGIDLAAADTVVGTSAGSVAGGLLLGGGSAAAYAAAIGSDDTPFDASALGDAPEVEGFLQAVADVLAQPTGAAEATRARLGELARRAPADRQDERLAVFERLLGRRDWPDGDLRVTTVDSEDGTFRVFDAESGASFLAAVAASCAVPVVYPTVEIDGRRYMDGGMRSSTNADLVAGADRVVVIATGPEMPVSPLGPQLDEAVAQLRASARVTVVYPDEASAAAFGANPLAQSSRRPSALAGYAQAAAVADAVREVWG